MAHFLPTIVNMGKCKRKGDEVPREAVTKLENEWLRKGTSLCLLATRPNTEDHTWFLVQFFFFFSLII